MNSMISLFLALLLVVAAGCGKSESTDMNEEAKQFIAKYERKAKPLSREYNIAYFDASISGLEEDYSKSADLELELAKVYADRNDFDTLKSIRESGRVSEPLLKRQIDVLYDVYLAKQIDEKKLEEMIRLQSLVEQKFSTFRAEMDGKQLTDNEVENILKTSTDSRELQNVWLASKEIGSEVADDVLVLVRMRNEAARELGFSNYHAMKLELGEQDPDEIEKLFDELDELTRQSFASLKSDIDEYLASRYGVGKEQLLPWHYQNRFFQEAPAMYDVDLDAFFADKDIVELTETYFGGIGLPIEDLVANSDLYEKEGKYQHAYCTDIDREGDVRVVCNIKPNYNWMNTTLHEFGHAVYDKFMESSVPWTLREPAHTFTTEAIAMIFGRFASHPGWLRDVAGIPATEVDKVADESMKSLRLEQLVFSRWAQVMYRFEKAMYENPEQDLNLLWWDLVERYQMLQRPEGRDMPDWASKIHVALYPAYYHNYLMGELFASQLYYYIGNNVLGSSDVMQQSFAGKKEVGVYLVEKVFKPGSTLYWNDMIKKATGEELTARFYAKQFVN